MGTTINTDVKMKPQGVGKGPGPGGEGGPPPPNGGEPNDWPPGWSREDAIEPTKYRIGMWVGLASILMLFVALTSAYVFRKLAVRGEGPLTWVTVDLPPLLWLTTAVIVASSVTMEVARRALSRSNYSGFTRWITATTALGLSFLVGQIIAWQQLSAQGIYVNSNPHSSFFYLLTSLHAIHLFGGIVALAYLNIAALRLRIGIRKRNTVNVTALYWHFMDGLWIYLFALLTFFK